MLRVFLLTIIALLLASSFVNGQTYSGPKRLGPFRIDRNTSAGSLFKQLGSPAQKAGPYCYESKDRRAFLHVATFESEPNIAAEVFLSDFPNCLHMPKHVTANDLQGWRTRAGIGLGSLEKDVLKAYGKPTSEEKVDLKDYRYVSSHMIRGYQSGDTVPQVGDKSISYNGDLSKDLSAAEFGIRNGKVSWIWLSHNE